MNRALRLQRALQGWVIFGLLGFALLPWYFLQQMSLTEAMPGIWGVTGAGAETASGAVQALQHGRPWLWFGLAGLLVCGLAVVAPWPVRRQGWGLLLGSLIGLLGLLGSGFAIGATGWSFESLDALWGTLPTGQYGMGWGAALVLLSLVVLLGAALARMVSSSAQRTWRRSHTACRLDRMSFTRELLPLPLTPVTQMNFPSGKLALTCFKLWCVAP